jgi:hypothetical protein
MQISDAPEDVIVRMISTGFDLPVDRDVIAAGIGGLVRGRRRASNVGGP